MDSTQIFLKIALLIHMYFLGDFVFIEYAKSILSYYLPGPGLDSLSFLNRYAPDLKMAVSTEALRVYAMLPV